MRDEKVRVDEGSTVGDLLSALSTRYGGDFERYIYSGVKRKGLKIVFLLDGRNILQLQGLATKLADGCTITMMPPVAGG